MMCLKYYLGLAICLILASCGSLKVDKTPPQTMDLRCSAVPENHYSDLSRGLNLNVTSNVYNSDIYDLSELPIFTQKVVEAQRKKFLCTFTPTIKEFVSESMSTYIRSMGINLGRDRENDYTLNIYVNEFKVVAEKSSARAIAILEYTLCNTDNETIIRQIVRGRYTLDKEVLGHGYLVAEALDKAYSKALVEIDWNSIAGYLQVHRRADQEAQRKVQGDGNTALEHTIIRWFIASTPSGADVYWRIISSTPDVKNTNSTYVGTTPYESTESFDIRGLKYENSGNVQIEVTCEKPGYLVQKKRFNLRQAIEQREISAKFNLVKEE